MISYHQIYAKAKREATRIFDARRIVSGEVKPRSLSN